MERGVPVYEMSPNKVEQRAIGPGMDYEQEIWWKNMRTSRTRVAGLKITKDI
jgi:hypothetical protein